MNVIEVRYTDEVSKHRYFITATDLRNGQRISPLVIDANNRTQAGARARRLGYDVHDVNMVG